MDEVKCKLCEEPVDVADFCFGCKSYVCDKHWQSPWGNHNPKDHDAVDGDDEGDDE